MKLKPFVKIALISSFFISGLTFLQSCKDDKPVDVGPVPTKNMLEVVSEAKYSIFKAALDKSKMASVLSGTTRYTIFAPTDDAMVAANIPNVDGMSETELANLIKYHMIEGEYTTKNIPAYSYLATMNTEGPSGLKLKMNLRLDLGTIRANGFQVLSTTQGTNGVVHEIGTVLKQPTVYDMIGFSSDLSKYKAGIDLETGIRDPLKVVTGLNTVFAVNNEGCTAYLTAKSRQFSSMVPSERRAFFNNGIVPNANKLAASLTAGSLTTQGDPLNVGMSGGNITLNDSVNVVITDIQCLNGVLHVVNKTLAK